MNETSDLTERATALQELLASQQTLLLSTASVSGIPGISYAPFVRDEGCFYILISELAVHTDNLFANPQASVMFVRSESESNILFFARERAIFDCSVKEIGRSDVIYQTQLTAMQDQFGEIVGVLCSLSDFHLFALSPESGRYVAGFGQAYTINVKDGSLSPLRKSHQKSS